MWRSTSKLDTTHWHLMLPVRACDFEYGKAMIRIMRNLKKQLRMGESICDFQQGREGRKPSAIRTYGENLVMASSYMGFLKERRKHNVSK